MGRSPFPCCAGHIPWHYRIPIMVVPREWCLPGTRQQVIVLLDHSGFTPRKTTTTTMEHRLGIVAGWMAKWFARERWLITKKSNHPDDDLSVPAENRRRQNIENPVYY